MVECSRGPPRSRAPHVSGRLAQPVTHGEGGDRWARDRAESQELRRQAAHALRLGNLERAERQLGKALRRNPRDHVALSLMAEVRLRRNDLQGAFAFCVRAVSSAPHVPVYKQRFLELARLGLPVSYSEDLANALVACLKSPEHASLLPNWARLMLVEPRFAGAYGLAKRLAFDPSNRTFFANLTDFAPLFSPLFLEGVKSGVVYNPVFEEFVVHIRRHLLADFGGARSRFSPGESLALASALSHYAFNSDFILDATNAEEEKADELRRRIETEEGGAKDAAAIAILACYRPLHTLSNARAILENFRTPGPLADVVKLQIADHFSLCEGMASIPSLTGVEDAVSARVREQYEDFPYPKWGLISRENAIAEWQSRECIRTTEATLAGRSARILIAGCGTGWHATLIAILFPNAKVTALDLSRRSLAFAATKAREHGLGNIAFLQADILKLGGREQRYDYVCAAGVLHHMQDPVAGWKILCGLLAPGGLMYICLYSRKGRRAVAAVREAIGRGNYPPTREGMLRFRRECPSLCEPGALATLVQFQDYYHLNMYRDLLFPAQEHTFDLKEIGQILDRLGLSFAGFFLPSAILGNYRALFPGDPQATDLENWDRFEDAYPDTFGTMYAFWCRPRDTQPRGLGGG